jgi:hypothetical protein
MWLTRDKADLTNKKLLGEFKFLETSASSGPVVEDVATADAPVYGVAKEQIVDQLFTLRKKYDNLVAFTVQLTAERDKLDASLKLQKEETLRARDGAKAALMHTEVVGQDSVALAQKAAMYDHLAAALMPTALSCTDVKADSLRFSWVEPQGVRAMLGYEIECTAGETFGSVITLEAAVGELFYLLTELSPGTNRTDPRKF